MPKIIDTRKQCMAHTPQGRQCKFKVTPGFLYCGVHKNQVDELNELARTQSVVVSSVNRAEVDDRWLPVKMAFADGTWYVYALNMYDWSKKGVRKSRQFDLSVYVLESIGDCPENMFDVRDPDAQKE